MTKQEEMYALRNDPEIHYNCAQAVLIPFADEMGITRAQARALAANFGGGMGCGSVCGALTGALMALGGLGLPEEQRQALLDRFAAARGTVNCSDLTAGLEHGTPERKALCDALVAECLSFVCDAMDQ